jgi:glycosyltransferase involved in cell wall biosynthesis
MKIFHLLSSSGFYGAERMIVTLTEALNRMGNPTTIGVFCNSHSPNTEIAAVAQARSQPVQLIPCEGRFDRAAVRALRAAIEKTSPDILHAHGYKADIYGYLASRGLNVTRISTCHTWYDNDLKVYLYGVLDRAVLRRFNMTVGVSEQVAKRLRSAGVARDKIRIISNGIDVEAFAQAYPALRRGPGPNCRLVGLVGRLAPEKGIQYFLQAATIVIRSHPNVEFVIVGDGPERLNLVATASKLGIQDKVRFLGKVDNMASVYASLDIVVSSSLKEGLPMTILEALAASRPVVATSVGAVPSVISHEQTGLLVPPSNADALACEIIRLLSDREFSEMLGRKGRQIVQERFSAEAMTTQYLKLYSEVIAARTAS